MLKHVKVVIKFSRKMVHQTTRWKNIKNDPISRPSNPIRVMGFDGVIAHAWS